MGTASVCWIHSGLSRGLTQGHVCLGVGDSPFVGIPLLLRVQGAPCCRTSSLGLWLWREWVGKVVAPARCLVVSAFSRGARWKLEAAHN